MALRTPGRVRSSTATAGSGTYTLTGPEPTAAGWRTFGDAVTAGDLANGDQVLYCVADLTPTPGVLEIGLGTYDHSAKTLTRDTVYQPNGTAVAWGAGTRDLFVIDPVMLSVLTLGDQTVAGIKTFTSILRAVRSGTALGDDGGTPLLVQNSGTAGSTCRAAIIAGNAGVSDLDFGDTDNRYIGRIFYSHSTDVLSFLTAGSVRATLDASAAKFIPPVQDNSGVPYEKFPSGGRLLWGTNSIPSGYAIVASLADKVILTTSTASEIDDQGGSWTVSGATIGSTTLSIAQIPAHTHDILSERDGTIVSADKVQSTRATADGVNITNVTVAEGGGGSHTHTFAQDGTWRPLYYKAGWIQKS